MKNIIFIRVDGGETIGLGHLVRCIALAQMLESDDFQISFFCKQIPLKISTEIKELRYDLYLIESEDDFLKRLTKDIIVVLDHYDLDTTYQKLVKDKGCKLVCIDDLHDKTFVADLIINHAPGVQASDYDAQIYTQYALGLDYALLRQVFLIRAVEPRFPTAIHSAFICFGGLDDSNITQTVVNIIKTDFRFKKVAIVVGAAYKYLDSLELSIENDERFLIYRSIDSNTICNLIGEAGLAIVPASGILLEVLAVGTRVISGMYIENQKKLFEEYKVLNAFENAEDFSPKNILLAIDNVFKSDLSKRKIFFDGRSGARLLKYFKQFQIEDNTILRRVKEHDLIQTFEWANNEQVRSFSFTNVAIDYQTHKMWFYNKLQDKNCYYYLGLYNKRKFGSIRFDIKEDTAVISYLVHPSFQNKNLGTVLVKKGLEIFNTESHKKDLTIMGEVFSQNLASLKVFEKLGFESQLDLACNIVSFKKTTKTNTKLR